MWWASEYSPPNTSWALCAGLVAPKSRGEIRLKSANPADRPVVDARFLSHPDDVKALAFGIEACREIGNSAAMKDFVKREVAPAKKLTGPDMEDFVRNGATTYFHQSGTCRMGKDGAGRGRLQAARQRRARSAHCRQFHHAPHRIRGHHGHLRPDRRTHGRHPDLSHLKPAAQRSTQALFTPH
jgi:hypothetical protein